MQRTYSFSQRLISHVLLCGFLLQSCYNPSLPLPHLPKAERQEISKKLPRPMSGNTHSQEETLSLSQLEKEKSIQLDEVSTESSQTSDEIPLVSSGTLNKAPIQSGNSFNNHLQTHGKPLITRKQSDRGTQLENKKLSLSDKKTISTSSLAIRPRSEENIKLPLNPPEKQPQTLVKLPIIQAKSTQPSLPETLQSTDYYEAKGGYQVKFMQQEQGCMAYVQDIFPGFHGSFPLPVYCIGMTIQELAQHKEPKQYIEVKLPVKGQAGYVVVGQQGLCGGGGNMSHSVSKDPIHIAAQDGNIRQIKALISWSFLGVNLLHVNKTDARSNTPLHYAAHNNREEAVKLLLSLGAMVDLQDNIGNTALHYVKSVPIAKALLDGGANINMTNSQGQTPLHYLINCKDIVQFLLQKGANPRISDNDGYTPLHLASNSEIIQLLLNYGADMEAKDNYTGGTPLFTAVNNKKLEAIIFFIAKGAKKEAQDNAGNTVLHQTIADFLKQAKETEGYFDGKEESMQKALREAVGVIKLLSELGVNPYIKNKQGKTPIDLALEANNPILINQLLKALRVESYKDPNGYTAFHLAVLNNDIGLFKQLVVLGADKNVKDAQGYTPLHYAAMKSNYYLVKLLIKLGVDINTTGSHGMTPLHMAVVNGNLELVKLLVNSGAKIEKDISSGDGYILLKLIAAHENSTLSKELLDALGIDLETKNKYGQTYLHQFVVGEDINMAELLIRLGANVHAKDKYDHTVLHSVATRTGTGALVPQLIALGVDPNAKNAVGNTPLHVAARHARGGALEMLLGSLQVKKNEKNKEGNTPLNLAVKKGNDDKAISLIQGGVDVNIADNRGITPLHVAIEKEALTLVKQLVSHGANMNLQDQQGSTPLHLALKKGNLEIVKFLAASNAAINKDVNSADGFMLLQLIAGYETLHLSSY